jgi:acetate kinase
MKILVINSGSSSIKYQLFDMTVKTSLASGLLEQIGEAQSRLTHTTRMADNQAETITQSEAVPDHRMGIKLIGKVLSRSGAVRNIRELDAIGHRVVHGGEVFQKPTLIDETVIATIRDLIPLAPLHNPANLLGIEVILQQAPGVPQVAVFDTAFHHAMPEYAYRYAIPEDLYKAHQVRRYGFHGSSHGYVARQAAAYLSRSLANINLITLHLGNGASMAAVQGGVSIDTSMGMTPLEGLIMGTRCGDIDPAIVFYLKRKTGLARDDVESILNKQSGLKGICGYNDMRTIGELARTGHAEAQLAIQMYCYRIKKYIGAYYAVLGHLEALVFTGGIGENADFIRSGACEGLSNIGIKLDPEKNRRRSKHAFAIHAADSSVNVLVVPTDEELEIAEQTVACIGAR